MNKYAYIAVNILAVLICVFMLAMGTKLLKILSLIGLFFILREFVTGKYKQYLT